MGWKGWRYIRDGITFKKKDWELLWRGKDELYNVVLNYDTGEVMAIVFEDDDISEVNLARKIAAYLNR